MNPDPPRPLAHYRRRPSLPWFGLVVFALILGGCGSASPDPEAGGDWRLVWADEFDGTAVDDSKWGFQTGTGCPVLCGWGNNELQYYRADNTTVSGGLLTITAKREAFEDRAYTSTRMRTRGRGDWTYGRFEMRAKLPTGQGIWPAFWMMPTESAYGGWAASGEIDIMEMVGHEPDRIHGTIHHGGSWPNNTSTNHSMQMPTGSAASEFHVYAAEWEEGEIRWYVNDSLFATVNDWFTEGRAFPAPFDRDFHLILNLAVGGNWPGNPDNTTVLPQELVVDYVRVYQR